MDQWYRDLYDKIEITKKDLKELEERLDFFQNQCKHDLEFYMIFDTPCCKCKICGWTRP